MAVSVPIFSALAIVAALQACVPITTSAAGTSAVAAPSPCVHGDGSATASCFGGGPHAINSTDATEVLQAALSSSASSLLIDDIGRPWVVLGLYPIVTFLYSSTTLYQFAYHIQYLFFESDNRISP
jgi:hypothetical protein